MITFSYLQTYAQDRNKPFTANQQEAEAAILVANEVLEAFYAIDDEKVAENVSLWERVQAEAALLQLSNGLTLPDGETAGEVIGSTDSVGSLSTSRTYAEGTQAFSKPRTPYLDRLIRPLLVNGSGMGALVRV